MILTGRPVTAQEALDWGLANRIVKDGTVREEAEKLASKIASFPQICMQNDRLSTYEQFGMNLKEAMKKEFEFGLKTLESGEFVQGSRAFTQGKGKHGKF